VQLNKDSLTQAPLASDLAVPFGKDSDLENSLNQLTLVVNDKNDVDNSYGGLRMSELSNLSRMVMSPAEHRRASEMRFFRRRKLLPTAWVTSSFSTSRTFELSRWLAPIPDWEPLTRLSVETPFVVSYLAFTLRKEYSCVWLAVYSE